MQKPLGAQISHMLKDRGVDVIFGIPGVHNQEMYRGIEEAGLTHVLARHEQGAGFMADGYARATGKPGVAYVITGPGLCNIMTPMGQAYSDSVPMLVISSCLDETVAIKGQLHQMKDQEVAARAVCDWSETGRTPDAFPPATSTHAAMQVSHDVSDVVCEALTRAKRPLFIFGGGAVDGAAVWDEILDLSGAASFTTYAGRGIGTNSAHHFGSLLARAGSADVIARADVVIAVGTELSEVDLWRDTLGHEATLIRIDRDPAVLNDGYADIKVSADAAQIAKETWGKREVWQGTSDWTAAEVADFRARMRAEIEVERPGILPVADALKEALPADAMIYSDMTQFAYAAKEVYPMDRPGHWHHPYGFGTLGYALPAAIGGKIGVGDQPVVAIAGDYGFQYTLQELMVAVELELTLPIIIWDNGKLGEIEDSMVRAQIAPNAVIQKNPDFVKLGAAYGAATAAPQSLDAFKDAIKTALAAKGPTIIYVRSDIASSG